MIAAICMILLCLLVVAVCVYKIFKPRHKDGCRGSHGA